MKIDLLHNKVIKDNITEDFIQSFNENIVPKLDERFGKNALLVQMYEDYLGYNLKIISDNSIIFNEIKLI